MYTNSLYYSKIKEVFMGKSELEVTDASKHHCQNVLDSD